MAKKLNSMPDYRARMPKHPHDVSQSTTLSFAPAMLLPVYYDILHIGDELHFSNNIFARLQNPITATLGEVDIHFDAFFVPLSVIYTPAPSLFYQTDDVISGLFKDGSLSTDRFPLYYPDSDLGVIREHSQGGVNAPMKDGNYTFPTKSFDCMGKAAYRLCDLLDISPYKLFVGGSSNNYNGGFTPWTLCAYHAIYELYFRNDDREPKRYQYNLDKYYDGTSHVLFTDGLLNLHYVSRYKDYFNSVKVSPIGSSVSMLGGTASWDMLSKVNSYLYSDGVYERRSAQGDSVTYDAVATTVGETSGSGTDFTLNAANIRQLFMVDKMLRVTGRANKDYESQFLAHFGIKIPHDVLHNITHIGHDMVSMSLSPITSTANTYNGETGSALGEIGGQGVTSMSGKKRNFTAPCHGVFMVVMSCQPKLRYFGGRSKLNNLSSPMDFWQPEYDKRGMQPIFAYETGVDSLIESTRVGWQYGFEHFKRKYDRVTTAFKNVYGVQEDAGVNFYSPWVLATKPYCRPDSGYMNHFDDYDLSQLNFIDLLATPCDLNTIMQIKYQPTWIDDLTFANSHLLFQTDPFIADYRMDCTKVNYMSEFSEPEID